MRVAYERQIAGEHEHMIRITRMMNVGADARHRERSGMES
jgi:hypothetical protein